MPLKNGNVTQAKFGTAAVGDTAKYLFTLPANSMIVGGKAFGTNFDAGTITLYARPMSSTTATSFATFAANNISAGLAASLTGTFPFNRNGEPVAITATVATAASGGPANLEVDYV